MNYKKYELNKHTITKLRDARINTLLCVQFGSDKGDFQIVVDTSTIDINLYKGILETKLLIGQNIKFDLQFLYNYNIIPRRVYDTMIVEQLLHLGYPSGIIKYSLKEIAFRRLGINIDKTVRGEIIWRGLDDTVIQYSAGDVMYLEKIMELQLNDCQKNNLMRAAQIECQFVPCIAYLEWCGIHLDACKWKDKMATDLIGLDNAKKQLDSFVIDLYHQDKNKYSKYVYINLQGDLFKGFDTEPKCKINWASSSQVIPFAKLLGFDTNIKDKKTGEDKESVMEKQLKSQKGINDEFLNIYFEYQGKFKTVTSFGQGHLNAINPVTNRLHTIYKQLGCISGRMSCGSNQFNTDLANFKGMPAKSITYVNLQQLPADDITRSCFTSPKGYLWSSCDYSALESRLGADIYNEQSMIEEFNHGSGDRVNVSLYGNI